MATPAGAMAAVVVANWWRGFPFFGVSFLAGMQSIPRELYEAASVDGAGADAALLARHAARAQARDDRDLVLSFILTINDFNIIYVMTRGGPGTATQVLATYSYEVAFHQLRWGRGVTICDLPGAGARGRHRAGQPLSPAGAEVMRAREILGRRRDARSCS